MLSLKKRIEEKKHCADDIVLNKFSQYMDGVLEYNKVINLTAIKDREEFIEKHFIESIECSECISKTNAKRVIDIGTGAGFPGVPNAILFPDCEFVLVDSVKKKLNVIDDVCNKSEIKNVTTIHERAETLALDKKHREKYEVCMSRAVSNLSVLSEYCLPFVKLGGVLITIKGEDIAEELSNAKTAVGLMGGEIESVYSRKLSSMDNISTVVIIRKVAGTPDIYPRKSGIPSRQPLV